MAAADDDPLVYILDILDPPTGNQATVSLKSGETTSTELSRLLSSHFQGQVVGLLYHDIVFPLGVVVQYPDVVVNASSVGILSPLFVFGSRRQRGSEALSSSSPHRVEEKKKQEESATLRLLGEIGNMGLLTKKEMELLVPLHDSEFVRAAVEVFAVEDDLEDLVDTLHRIVAIRSPKQQVATMAMKGMDGRDSTGGSSKDRQRLELLSRHLTLPSFPAPEILEIIESFHEDGTIQSGENMMILTHLVAKEHPYLQGAYERFNESGNTNELRSNFDVLANYFSLSNVLLARDDFPKDQANAIIEAFLDSDARVTGAWDVYVDEHDADDFAETLAVLVPHLLSQSKKARAQRPLSSSDFRNGAAPTDERTVLRRLVIGLHAAQRVDDEQGAKLMSLVDSGSSAAREAAREYLNSTRTGRDAERLATSVLRLLHRAPADEDDDDDEEEEESEGQGTNRNRSLEHVDKRQHTSQEAEEPVYDEYDAAIDNEREALLREGENLDDALADEFYAFVRYLVESGNLDTVAGQKLDALIEQRDSRILATFDYFSQTRDTELLIEGLNLLAQQVQLVALGNDDDDIQNNDDEFEMVASKEDEYSSGEEDEPTTTLRSSGVVVAPPSASNVADDDEFADDEQLIKDLGLSLEELRTLKHAVKSKHPDAMRALDAFVQTQNSDALTNDLKATVKKLMAAGYPSKSSEKMTSRLPAIIDPVEELVQEGLVSRETLSKIPTLLMEEARQAFEQKPDEETFRETVLRLAKSVSSQ